MLWESFRVFQCRGDPTAPPLSYWCLSMSSFHDKKRSPVPLTGETRERGCDGGAGVRCHVLELEVEFKPIEHPTEPSYDDRPVQCPMLDPSVPTKDVRKQDEQFAESLRKRSELTWVVNDEAMVMVATDPPAGSVRKRHHTLTRARKITHVQGWDSSFYAN